MANMYICELYFIKKTELRILSYIKKTKEKSSYVTYLKNTFEVIIRYRVVEEHNY